MSLLHWACDRGHRDVAELLINNGADMNCQVSVNVCVSVSLCLLMCMCVCVCLSVCLSAYVHVCRYGCEGARQRETLSSQKHKGMHGPL